MRVMAELRDQGIWCVLFRGWAVFLDGDISGLGITTVLRGRHRHTNPRNGSRDSHQQTSLWCASCWMPIAEETMSVAVSLRRRISVAGVDRIFAKRSGKGQQQDSRQTFHLAFVAVLGDADSHVVVPCGGLLSQCSRGRKPVSLIDPQVGPRLHRKWGAVEKCQPSWS